MHKQQPTNQIDKKQFFTQEQKFEKRKIAYQYFATLGNLLKKELTNLEQKKNFTHDNNDPSCPLCEQNLSASRRRFLKIKFTKQERFLKHRLNRLHAIIPNLKTILINQHNLVDTYKNQCEKQTIHALKVSELQKNKKKIEILCHQLKQQINEQRQAKNIITKQLTKQKTKIINQEASHNSLQKNNIYQQLVKQIQKLQKVLENKKYDTNQHKKTQKQFTIVKQKLIEYETIHKEINKQEQRKYEINTFCTSLKKIKQINDVYKQKIASYKNLSQEWANLEKQEFL